MSQGVHVFNVLFDDRFGGPSKRVLLTARRMREGGFSTTLVLPEGRGNVAEIAREAGVPVVRLAFSRIPRPRNLLRVLLWLLRLPIDVSRFLRLYQRQRPDVVHVNGAFFFAPAWASRLAGIPLVWHLNDVLVPRAVAPLFGAHVRLLASQVVVSARAVGIHYGVASARSTVLFPPVDVEAVRPRQERLGASGPVRIGLIANWNPIKGVDFFVRAAAEVHTRLGDDLRVVFAGARLSTYEEYRQRVDLLIDELGLRPVVIDHGFLSDVTEVLRELDIVVMSSTSEAVSMVILEGMAAGLPLVATDIGGVKELLLRDPDRPAGVIVPPADPEAMAEAILGLIRDPERARSMGGVGRRRAETCFSAEVATERHLEIYRRALGSKGAAINE
jgi:glycosyltransferase involved in cell wall biosynthesis